MRIGIASCRDLPAWERDDAPLLAALDAHGIDAEVRAWDAMDAEFGARMGAVLLRTTWDYVPRHAEFLRWCHEIGRVTTLLNPAAVVGWNLDKIYLRELSDAGLEIAPTHWCDRGAPQSLRSIARARGWSSVFVKPRVGASASDTARAQIDDEPALEVAQRMLDRAVEGPGALVQPYLRSVEDEGERSWIVIDGEVTHAVRKVPRAGDYRVQDDWGAHDEPLDLRHDDVERALAAVSAAQRRLGTRLVYARVDMLADARGRWVLNELELVEPSLFFRHGPHAAGALTRAIAARLGASGAGAGP